MVLIYYAIMWINIAVLVRQKEIFDLEKMKTTVGRFLGIWTSFGILLEFIPLIWHLFFIRATIMEKELAKDYKVNDTIFDPLRELIVEYLIKGINRAMLQQDKHKYYEILQNKGTLKEMLISPHPLKFLDSEILAECQKREMHSFAFRRAKKQEKLGSAEFLLDSADKLEKYIEFIITAPSVFRMIRKYFGIDDNLIGITFSTDKLKNGELHIKLGSGKGGSFFIYPKNARYLLKAIGGSDFDAIKQLLPNYFTHLLAAGQRSYINPIIAIFTINIKGENMIEPLHFMLMPNVLPFDKNELSMNSKILTFDIKGSLGQRMCSLNPEKLTQIELLSKKELEMTYKDVDFLRSFRTLELSKDDAMPILAQLRKDTILLSDVNIFDYSVVLFLVATLLINTEDFIENIKYKDCEKEYRTSFHIKNTTKENFGIIELKCQKEKISIKYSTNLCTIQFYIKKQDDLINLRQFLLNIEPKNTHTNLNNNNELLRPESRQRAKSANLLFEEEKFIDLSKNNIDSPSKILNQIPNKTELINENINLFDFKQFPIPDKQVKLINFRILSHKSELQENYILIHNIKDSVRSLGIMQLAIKQNNELYLWNWYLEIIDYLSKYSLTRRLEKSFKTTIMKEPSVEEPKRYSERFIHCFKTILTKDEIQFP